MGGETGETGGAGCRVVGRLRARSSQCQWVGYEARAWQRSPNQRW